MEKRRDRFGAYKEYLIGQEMSENTVEKYLRDAKAFCRYLGDQPLVREQVLKYKKKLLELYKVASVNSMLTAVNHFLKWNGRRDLCIRTCRQQRQIFRDPERNLTREEYYRLLRAARSERKERLSCLLQAVAGTGMRIGELRYLTVEALKSRKIEINFKGKQRIILIPRSLEVVLKDYCRKKRIRTGCIFRTSSGRPLDRKNIWMEMKRLCKTAKVMESKVFPHNLRHLFARCFYEREKDLARLADYLGHSSIETTRRYTMLSSDEICKTTLELRLSGNEIGGCCI